MTNGVLMVTTMTNTQYWIWIGHVRRIPDSFKKVSQGANKIQVIESVNQ